MKRATIWLVPGCDPIFTTPGPSSHFFGYYDKSPFDATGRHLLSHRVGFSSTRDPLPEDTASIVVWDLETGDSRELATTHAFNWQQGAMLQWMGPDYRQRMLYNDFREGCYVSVILDRQTGCERVLPLPVYSLSPDGRWALCVDYDRLFWCRKGYAYACGGDPRKNVNVPQESGIRLMDLETGEHQLVVSTRQMYDTQHLSNMEQGANYLEHVMFSPSGKRFVFLHRWCLSDGGIMTRAYVARRDGSELRLVCDVGELSHFTWRNDDELLFYGARGMGINQLRQGKAWAGRAAKLLLPVYRKLFRSESWLERKVFLKRNYFLMDIATLNRTDLEGSGMDLDGHPSFRPGSEDEFLSDTYSDRDGFQHLYMFSITTGAREDFGCFYVPDVFRGGVARCDLHPRWDRQGKSICFDSTHSGSRQMHVVSLASPAVGAMFPRKGDGC